MPLTQVSSRLIEDTLRYVLGASGTSHYTFTGKGLNGAVNDPTLTLSRGHTYIFENRSGGHPFYIKTSIANGGTNDAYNTGVTNNGGGNGTEIVFKVPHDAPDTLYYQCSSHSSMAGQLSISGSVADGSITTAKLAADAVDGTKIADDAINSEHLVADSIDAEHYAAGSVDTTAIADDAVTADKLADAINALIAANTAKTSGITMYNRFNNTTNTSGTANPLTTWSRNTATETGNITGQSNMSVSSGRFSFPSTGIYRITVQHDWYQPSGSDRAIQMSVRLSNTDFSGDSPQKVYTYGSTGGVGGYNNHGTNHCTYVVKISNTSTEKIEIWTTKVNSSTITTTNTYVDFERIAD